MPIKSQIVYKGRNFESVSDLARYLKIKPSTLHTRISKEVPQDKWNMKSYSNSNPNGIEIIYKNKKYSSFSSLAKEIGISESALRKKIKNGRPEEEWNIRDNANEVFYKGKKYLSINVLAKEIGISEFALRKKIKDGRPEEEWNIRDNAKEVIYKGKKYLSISSLAKEINVNPTTLLKKINDGMKQEEWDKIKNVERISYKGIEYGSIQNLSNYLDINYHTLYSRIKKGLPEEKWADDQIKINYQNKSFNTITSFAKFLNIPGRTNKLRNLLKSEKDINIVVKKALINEKKEIYFYKDQEFKSFSSLVNFLGFNSRKETFKKLLTKNNDIEETINIMKKTDRKVSIEYGGETFESYKSLAEKLNVSVNNLRYKIQNGFPKNEWGIEKKIKKIIKYKDKSFNSLSSFSNFLGIQEKVLKWRMEYLSEDKWNTKQNFEIESKIEFEGKVFENLNSIAKFLNITRYKKNKFADLINNGIPVTEAIRIIKKDHRKIVNITYKGNEYRLSTLAKFLKINSSTLKGRIESNWPENRWGEKLNNYNITYQGKVFASIAQLAKHLKVSINVLEKRIKKNWPEEKWGDEKNNYAISYKGKIYKSINELAKHIGIRTNTLSQRIRDGVPEDNWGSEIKNYEISYKGKIYNSVNDLAKHLKINSGTLLQRIRKGLPEDKWGGEIQNYEISYQGKIYKSIFDLAKHLGINAHTLAQRIRDGVPEDKWGGTGLRTKISTGYTWDEAPKHLKEAAEKLAVGLNISALEAYQLLLEKIDFK